MRDDPAVTSNGLHNTTAFGRNRARQHLVSSAINEVEFLLVISADAVFKFRALLSPSGFIGACGVLCESWCESCDNVGRGKRTAADCASGKEVHEQCDRR